MSRPLDSLISAAERSSVASIVPRHLIRSYVEVLQVPQPQRDEHMRIIASWLNKRHSTSTISSHPSSLAWSSDSASKRNTQHSFASSNTAYSWGSIDSRLENSASSPDVPYSVHETPTIESETTPASPALNEQDRFVVNNQKPFSSHGISYVLPYHQRQEHLPCPELKPFMCPWCEQRIGRAHDLKTHVRDHCGSRTIWMCLKCGNRAHSMKQANRHRYQDKSKGCKTYNFHKIDLDYDRQAYGCRHYGFHFTTLDDYVKHLIRRCHSNRVVGNGDRNLQIRGLLQQPAFKKRVEEECSQKWGFANAVHRLCWDWPEDRLAEIVERLEYGELNVPEGEINCGIPSLDVPRVLTNLVRMGKLVSLGSTSGPAEAPERNITTAVDVKPSMNKSGKISDWLHGLQPLPIIVPPSAQQLDLAQDTSPLEAQDSLVNNIAHRPKRPVSDNSAQHPESTKRSGLNPFMGSPFNKAIDDTFIVDMPPPTIPPSASPDPHIASSYVIADHQTDDQSVLLEEPTASELDELLALFPGDLQVPMSTFDTEPGIASHHAVDEDTTGKDKAIDMKSSYPHFDGPDNFAEPAPTSFDVDIDSLPFLEDYSALFSMPIVSPEAD